MQYFEHLYLSPHFDDVALSCGGRIFQKTVRGEAVLVVTVTGGEPPRDLQSVTVESLHKRWHDSLGDRQIATSIVEQRRAEDRAAFDVLRAGVLHLSFLDSIYRTSPDGRLLYPGPTDMFGTMNPKDSSIVPALAQAFSGLPPATQIYAPLGVGRHIDHPATRLAAEQVFHDLAYYEDYPYTMRPGALEEVLPLDARAGWAAETVQLTQTALAAKIEAVAAYQSQISSFFTGTDDLAEKLAQEGQRVLAGLPKNSASAPAGAERVWRRLSR
jgi:LmbE family N-acetylglucosaminyl deacetylase